MSEITLLLRQAPTGDPSALASAFASLYQELHRIAAQRFRCGESTLSPTVLVNEAYLRLCGGHPPSVNDSQHFLALAQRIMHAVWVDHLRKGDCVKHGGGLDRVPEQLLDQVPVHESHELMFQMEQSLQMLGRIDPALRQVVELRLLAGMELAEVAERMDASLRTTERRWQRARALIVAQWEIG